MQNNCLYIHTIDDIPPFIEKNTYLFFYDDEGAPLGKKFFSNYSAKGKFWFVPRSGPPTEYSYVLHTFEDITINKENNNAE